jgi:anthranilate phosphoribosyltransferase
VKSKQAALADAATALRARGATDAELWAFARAVRAAFQQGSGLGGGQITAAMNGERS